MSAKDDNARYRETHRDELAAKSRAYYRANRERALAAQREYRAQNAEQIRVRSAEKRARTKDAIKLRGKKYRSANREALAASKAAYAKRNRERINARTRAWLRENPDKGQEYYQRYVAKGGERVRAMKLDQCHRRNARLHGAPVSGLRPTEWARIKEEYGHRCAYCGTAPKRLERDHIDALATGGAHAPENVAPACRRCNASKSDDSLLVWLASGRAA